MASNYPESWDDEDDKDIPDSWEDMVSDDQTKKKEGNEETELNHDVQQLPVDLIDDEDWTEISSTHEMDESTSTSTQQEERGNFFLISKTRPGDKRINIFTLANTMISEMRPQYVNLMNDFVESELFVIDGDSLLLEVLSTPSLDFKHGGQYLQLIYLAEQFLQYFTQRGGLFNIVFFKCMKSVWHSHPSMQLARHILISHLQMNTQFPVVTTHGDWYEKNWLTYLHDNHPAFIMVADGDTKACFGETNKNSRFLFQTLILHSLSEKVNVAYPSEIQHTVTKLFGYYIESHYHVHMRINKEVKAFKPIFMNVLKLVVHENIKSQSVRVIQKYDIVQDKKERLQKVISKYLIHEYMRRHCSYSMRTVVTLAACVDVLEAIIRKKEHQKISVYYDLAYVYFVHAMLMAYLPLQVRAQSLPANSTGTDRHASSHWKSLPSFIQRIQLSLYQILLQLDVIQLSVDETHSITDIMDGRLFYRIMMQLTEDNSLNGVHEKGIQLPESISDVCSTLWQLIVDCIDYKNDGSGANMSLPQEVKCKTFTSTSRNEDSIFSILSRRSKDSKSAKTCTKQDRMEGLIPVQCDLVEKFAGDVMNSVPRLNVDKEEVKKFLVSGNDFDEKYHWHSGKPFADEYDNIKDTSFTALLPKDPWQRKKLLKDKQKLARHMQRYGESLHGQLFGVRQETIIVEKRAKGQRPKQSGIKKDAIIKGNIKDKEESSRKTELNKWQFIQKEKLVSLLGNGNYGSVLQEIDIFVYECKSDAVIVDAMMKKLDYAWQAWQHQKTMSGTRGDSATTKLVLKTIEGEMYYPVQMFDTIQTILDKYDNLVTNKDKSKMAEYVLKLGFQDMALKIVNYNAATTNSRSLPSNTSVDERFTIKGLCSARFQLQHMGHLLKRDVRSDPDPRVSTFIPDTWQRELLDAVDNNESAVIVAPTSSGKTFASFYCMRKILKEDHDGVVVYVAPTKALVNQVAAEINARFKKDLPGGKSLYGVFTRDMRKDTLNCQILVTVPQCLEILLLSPRRQKWTEKMKYVIFDEVHCLGSEFGAEVWEHLLVTIPCPFLALSATIRNPKDLQSWLQGAQDFRKQLDDEQGLRKRLNSYRVRLVTYHERYSDLNKYLYLPTADTNTLLSAEPRDSKEGFVTLHPAAVLSFKELKKNGFPGDMSFSSHESLQLYDLMKDVWSLSLPEQLNDLEPSRYFNSKLFITRGESRTYEKDVKKELMRWLQTPEGTSKAREVIESIQRYPRNEITKHYKSMEKTKYQPNSQLMMMMNFMTLLEQLQRQDRLPAIVFSFDRNFCEILAKAITKEFERREEEIKKKFRNSERGRRAGRVGKSQQKSAKRQRDKKTDKKNQPDDNDDDEDSSVIQEDEKKLMDDDYVLEQCTFASQGTHSKEDLGKILRRVQFDGSNQMLRYIKRGIAYHHAGLNNKWRMAVETLFRTKYLKVVVATGTLALGIHMPCKTVIFAGDSVYLDATQYRQMSGRAGRRGFDPVGNVIFFGLPKPKIERLIMANVPHLKGNFPISVTLVLRLMLLAGNADLPKDALGKALSLLKHPFLCHDRPEMTTQIKHYFLFSIEYLIRKGLLDINGIPQGLAGLATHLHYHEPSNFVLVTFLRRGAFHKLCKREPGESKFSEHIMRKLVAVLANLFGRHRIQAGNAVGRSSSMVILEPLPDLFHQLLEKH